MISPAGRNEPLTDSPWFWVYLFATTALILLVVFRPKLEIRQASIERQHQARERAWTKAPAPNSPSEAPPDAVSTPGDTVIGLHYLYWVLGFLVLLGWVRLWYVRYRPVASPSRDTNQGL